MIRRTNVQQRVRRYRGLMVKFAEVMEITAKRMHMDGGKLERVQWEGEDTEKELLMLRRDLRDIVKQSIDSREDHEVEIAVLSSLIWFMRLEMQQRDRILSWGM
jgi:hypothetical protein